MIPFIALVGRPNVGKSTLFNRLTKSREALVADFPGLTRDRKFGSFECDEHRFALVDTGGIYITEETAVDQKMAEQSLQAAQDADLILWLVDARDGLTAADQELVTKLRQMNKPLWLVVNKIDGLNIEVAQLEFYSLGVEKVVPISASQGRGVGQLKELFLEKWPDLPKIETQDTAFDPERIRVAVLGRPNVGKSTLVNRVIGEERVVVFDMPGTTRDSVYIDFEKNDTKYTLIDTAGIRRRKNIKLTVEKFSIVKTIKAIDDSQVVVLIMDAQEGLVDQDLHLLGMAIKAGRAIVLAFNKWDGLEPDQKNKIKNDLQRRLQFIDYVKIHYISAMYGSGVGDLFKTVNKVYKASQQKLSTSKLTTILEGLVFDHVPPMVNGRRIKLRYAHAGGHNPPVIVIHGNQVNKVPAHYTRYLEKGFRKHLKLYGTPIRIEFKGHENPFEGKKKKLPSRLQNKKRFSSSKYKK